MPRFYFHSEDGAFYRDKAGTVLPDLQSARREGVKIFAELILHDPDLFLKTEAFKVIIQDENQLTLYVFDMSGIAAPVAGI